jgi:hypothetical protein
MTERRHTSGPWVSMTPLDLEVDTGLSRRDMGARTGNAVISSFENRWIALAQVATHVEGRKSSEGVANAYLISAAPDMLDALTAVLLFVKPTKANAAALNAAHIAVKKAEGRA